MAKCSLHLEKIFLIQRNVSPESLNTRGWDNGFKTLYNALLMIICIFNMSKICYVKW